MKNTYPTREDVLRTNLRFYGNEAGDYEAQNKEKVFGKERQDTIASVLRFIVEDARRRNGTVKHLDAGCGTGNILRHTKGMVDLSVGCDLVPECLKLSARYNDKLVRADVAHLPFGDGSFDIVTAHALMHHLFDYNDFLKETRRVLRSGGWLYTDLDQNSLRLPVLVARLRGRAVSLCPFLGKVKKAIKRSGAGCDLSDHKVANFQNAFKGGIDPLALARDLKKMGFPEVRSYVYNEGSNRVYKAGGVRLLKSKFFYCIAKKG